MSNKKEVKNKEELISIKVTMVGNVGVGKTCIVKRLVKNEYDESGKSTVGANYSKYEIFLDNKKIILDIWDTAGQEIYRALSKNFYLNASVGIIVYDITRKSSFESIKEYWYDQLKTFGEENMIFEIVGNKMDLYQKEEISEEMARSYAKSIRAGFHLISCKENVGIKDLFEDCGKKYLEVNGLTESNAKGKKKGKNKRNIKLNKNIKQKKKCCG